LSCYRDKHTHVDSNSPNGISRNFALYLIWYFLRIYLQNDNQRTKWFLFAMGTHSWSTRVTSVFIFFGVNDFLPISVKKENNYISNYIALCQKSVLTFLFIVTSFNSILRTQIRNIVTVGKNWRVTMLFAIQSKEPQENNGNKELQNDNRRSSSNSTSLKKWEYLYSIVVATPCKELHDSKMKKYEVVRNRIQNILGE
jgi:hypothetical protein